MKKIALFSSILVLFCCNKKNVAVSETTTELPDSIVLSFYDVPDNFSFPLKSGGEIENGRFDVQYFADSEVINFKHGDGLKTKEIVANTSFVEVVHTYNAIDEVTILVQEGDAVAVRYSDKKPSFKVTNRVTKKHDLDYDFLLRATLFKSKYPYYIQSKKNPVMYLEDLSVLSQKGFNLENFKKAAFLKGVDELSREKIFLDSIYKKAEISSTNYSYYKQRNFFNLLHINLNNKIENDVIDYKALDSLVKYKFYRDYIRDFAIKKHQIKGISASNSSILDSKTAFDSVAKSTLFGERTRQFLLYDFLKGICEDFNKKDAGVYLDQFLVITKDTVGFDRLKGNYFFSSQNTTASELSLLGSDKKPVNFKALAAKKKVVYVDFWASWCAPCRAAMPASKKLHEKYGGKDIAFVYVSIDSNFEAWKKANVKEGLGVENSLLATNYPEASFYKEHLLKSIPRYMIYVNGKLVNNNAPSPDSKEIVKALDTYLE
ncbi:TlpA family protein disulfide reductase [Flavobacterium sp.]|uniref:TlpA family protein disulfide reductase n=3 Tax=Flavobacterium sp. TaxID=239 RepID=UPI004047469B